MAGVAQYEVRVGDDIIKFEGPDDLTDRQIERLADRHLRTAKPGQKFPHSVYNGEGTFDVPDNSSAMGAFLRNLPHDALFNFDDEIAAGADAAIPGLAALDNTAGDVTMQGPGEGQGFWDRFKANMAELQRQQNADENEHSLASSAGRIGGLLSTMPRAATAVAARLPEAIASRAAARPILTGIGLGAGTGAISGAGAGEEGTRGQSAALGALAGGATGGAVSTSMEIAPWLARKAQNLFNNLPHSEAVRQIVLGLKRDGFDVTSPTGVAKLKSALQEFTGKPVSLADIGGATRARAGVALRTPSDTQQQAIDQVMNRAAGQSQRIAADVRANVAPRTDVHALNEDLVTQRAAEAQRLRDQALFENAPVEAPPQRAQIVQNPDAPDAGVQRTLGIEPPASYSREMTATNEEVPALGRRSRIVDPMNPNFSPEQRQAALELQNLVRLPDSQRALKAALERSTAERDLLATTGQSVDHLPDLSAGSDLDVRTLDTLKRFLDDEVTSLYRRGDTATFKAGQAAQVKNLRDAIRERLRVAVPEYGNYLDAYRGSSEMIDALEAGQKFDKLAPEQIAAEQAGRSTAAKELYRVGTARNLLDKINETPDTGRAASRVLNSDESRAQLLATGVDPAAAARLNRSVQQERVLNLLPQELSNSATQQRLLAQADADSGIHASLPFNPVSKFSWLGAIGRSVLNRSSVTRNAAVNEQILPRLLETNPKAVDALIDELYDNGNIALAKTLRRRAAARKATLGFGTVIGGPVALGDE